MIGEKVRELREANNVLLRQLAAQLDMDTALLSKMERGDRAFRKEDLVKIASIFKVSERELLIVWLAVSFGETDHAIPWQIDHLIFWRR